MEITRDEAIKIAEEYDLKQEVTDLIDSGYSPEEALEDWDILPDEDDGFYCDDDYYCDD